MIAASTWPKANRQSVVRAARQRWTQYRAAHRTARACSCGHCPDCKARQAPEDRLRQHLAEVGAQTASLMGSSASDLGETFIERGQIMRHFPIGGCA